MGNCLESYGGGQDHERQFQEEMKRTDLDYDDNNNTMEEDGRENIEGFGDGGENGFDEKKNTGFRVKIVLTKEELEWFLLQLQGNNSKGGNKKKKLEDVLGEMQRSSSSSKTGRWKVDLEDGKGWKPSLDSIMESPEVPDQMDR